MVNNDLLLIYFYDATLESRSTNSDSVRRRVLFETVVRVWLFICNLLDN